MYKTYGTAMAGLKAIGYDFEFDEYNSFVHGRLPYNVLLKPDPVLRGILQSLPIRKIIFTNADSNHAISALKILGLDDCFERIISFDTLNPSNNTNPSESKPTTEEVLNICEHLRRHDSDMVLPRTPVVCKPFDIAYAGNSVIDSLAITDGINIKVFSAYRQIFGAVITILALVFCF
ncbi:uncharacterized protein LOC106755887 [Vigna radiata var. radiata]|uniref:Uncharacterized protein LOC106755887 n=1 Tax=Vigna radiata var. radiata TaxID=3916 RepID=A0A1S3TIJ2_VIGRR|nr:uncharacterized protein LOC106755887 [Vigna radiata var. radiata]XP_014493597.1 uncharacterized protein LOC106755887 [Vigna radiata var. radiata]XP_014493598.1 uncharacterized protein LOC106755887 [Vigna radiata var. radiata]XP_014493600.1 uncharacterized protein LOC106755887 [Vigna radiata var. radiata]XP_022643280.1 uncharacterized protein LOC106755887 [Vigna radiata var. radiata]